MRRAHLAGAAFSREGFACPSVHSASFARENQSAKSLPVPVALGALAFATLLPGRAERAQSAEPSHHAGQRACGPKKRALSSLCSLLFMSLTSAQQ